MKKLLAIPLLFMGMTLFAQPKNKTAAVKDTAKTKSAKYTDNIDDRMKGPNGEKVYIGPNGGRYYLKDDKKVYVPLKKKKS